MALNCVIRRNVSLDIYLRLIQPSHTTQCCCSFEYTFFNLIDYIKYITCIIYSSISKPCILITRGILFTYYRKTLYTNCTLFNHLIIVSGYNKIVHFLIKNELQSPYIKYSLVKPQLILQVTPLSADNRTWYTHPTMIIEHVAEAHLNRCYLVHVIVKIKYICDNQYLCHNKLTQSNHSTLYYTYQTHIT